MEEVTTPNESPDNAPEAEAAGAASSPHPAHHHGPPQGFIRKYIFSIDHKVIGIQYLLLALFAAFVGMFMSVLMRLNLTWPGRKWAILETLFPLGAPGGVISPEFYLSLVTMHGTIMVFFVLTTAPSC
jgi:cytochrome c oxidase subunit I